MVRACQGEDGDTKRDHHRADRHKSGVAKLKAKGAATRHAVAYEVCFLKGCNSKSLHDRRRLAVLEAP